MRTRRILSVFLVVAVLFSVLSYSVTLVSSSGDNWLTGWGLRKSHLITASAGAGTNYQIGTKVYKTTGTDGTEVVNGVTMGKVYVGSNCRDDFGDIRFTDNDGDTLLDYWQDSRLLVSGTSSVFWVEVADTLESDATIYVYYSKSDATTSSNGTNTFLLFDDFDDSSFNTAKWTDDDQGGGIVTEPAGTALLLDVHPAVSSDNSGVRSIATFTNSVAFLVRRKQAANNKYYIGMSLGAGTTCDEGGGTTNWWLTTSKSGYWCRFYFDAHTTSEIYEVPASGASTSVTTTGDVAWSTCDVYAIWEMRYDQNGVLDWRIDGTSKVSGTDTTFLSNAKKFQVSQGSYAGGAYGSDTSVDYVIGRKFIASEPAHSTWGIEESAVTSVSEYGSIQLTLALSSAKVETFTRHGLVSLILGISDTTLWSFGRSGTMTLLFGIPTGRTIGISECGSMLLSLAESSVRFIDLMKCGSISLELVFSSSNTVCSPTFVFEFGQIRVLFDVSSIGSRMSLPLGGLRVPSYAYAILILGIALAVLGVYEYKSKDNS